MKIFTSEQVRAIDQFTIENEPIRSIDLMERAAKAIHQWFVSNYSSSSPVCIFSGTGNNGGDGVALGRMLALSAYKVRVFIVDSGSNFSSDLQRNIQRLINETEIRPEYINSTDHIPILSSQWVVIDAIFGSGLSRSPEGIASEVINSINESDATVIAIDIPSGLLGEHNPSLNAKSVIRAHVTVSLQFPKLSFLFPEPAQFVGNWTVLPIGLHPEAVALTATAFELIQNETIETKIFPRERFSHKGTYGHCLLVAGMYGMCGAAILAAKAAMRAGAGLVTVHTPSLCYPIVQQGVHEAIFSIDEDDICFTNCVPSSKFSAVAVGPGIGTQARTLDGLIELLGNTKCPMIIDADALNLIASMPELVHTIPRNSILTPHAKEFERLFGSQPDSYSRMQMAREKAAEHSVIIIIKGAYSQIVSPDGRVFFNSTGNPGMATAGSGDVLTGIIASLLAQRYKPLDAAVIGTYIHGLAGDMAASQRGQAALLASDIIEHIGYAFKKFEKS